MTKKKDNHNASCKTVLSIVGSTQLNTSGLYVKFGDSLESQFLSTKGKGSDGSCYVKELPTIRNQGNLRNHPFKIKHSNAPGVIYPNDSSHDKIVAKTQGLSIPLSQVLILADSSVHRFEKHTSKFYCNNQSCLCGRH